MDGTGRDESGMDRIGCKGGERSVAECKRLEGKGVAPMLGRSNTAANALSEFQTFVSRLDQWGVGVMMDGTFNHSAPDAILGQGAVDLQLPEASAGQKIRDYNPGW